MEVTVELFLKLALNIPDIIRDGSGVERDLWIVQGPFCCMQYINDLDISRDIKLQTW